MIFGDYVTESESVVETPKLRFPTDPTPFFIAGLGLAIYHLGRFGSLWSIGQGLGAISSIRRSITS